MQLKEKLRLFRVIYHLTQNQVAALCGVTRQTVTKWETGRAVPRQDPIDRLCECVHVSAEEFMESAEEYLRRADDDRALQEYLAAVAGGALQHGDTDGGALQHGDTDGGALQYGDADNAILQSGIHENDETACGGTENNDLQNDCSAARSELASELAVASAPDASAEEALMLLKRMRRTLGNVLSFLLAAAAVILCFFSVLCGMVVFSGISGEEVVNNRGWTVGHFCLFVILTLVCAVLYFIARYRLRHEAGDSEEQ